MTGPSIRVAAEFDTSSLEQGVKKLKAEADAINQSLDSGSVGIDIKTAKAQLAELEKQATSLAAAMEGVSAAGDKAAGVDFDAAADALESAAKAGTSLEQVLEAVGQSTGMGETVKQAKSVGDHLNRAAKAQRDLAKEGIKLSREQAVAAKEQFDKIKGSGARGTSRLKGQEFDDWASGGWRDYSLNDAENKRMRRNVFKRIGLEVPEARGDDDDEDEDRGRGRKGRRGGGWSGRLASAAGGAITGSISGGGLGIGTIAGAAGGMVPYVGAVLGPVLGAIGGAIDKGLERALSEAGDLTDLRHSLGATAVDFDSLRNNVRHFADGLGVTYNEAAKLAKQFAHTANSSENIGQETGRGIGFARGFGMDPSAAVQFFATMRHFGSTQNEKDSKRLALTIAEAVTKGGVSAKADEALSAIQNYVESSTRHSLTEANTDAYASFMASMTGLPHYGMKGDPASAAAAMGKADASLRQGGGFGEASKNFSLGLYQRVLPGASSFDMDFLNEQGAFGTVDRAFGKDSPAYALAKERGDKSKMAQYDDWSERGGGRSMLSLQMDALSGQYGGNTDEFRKAMQNHLGVSASEASALYQANKHDNGLGGLQENLEGAGVDINSLNTKQVASLAEISTGSREVVKTQAQKLSASKELNSTEKKDLADAIANADKNPEELRKVVLQLSAVHDVTRDQGEEMRRLQSDIANSMQRLATQLIPLTVQINTGISALVKHFAPDSPEGVAITAAQTKGHVFDSQLDASKHVIDNWDKVKAGYQGNMDDAQKHLNAAVKSGDRKGISDWTEMRNTAKGYVDGMNAPNAKRIRMDSFNRVLKLRNGLTEIGPSELGEYDLDSGNQKAPPRPAAGTRGGARRGPTRVRADRNIWRDKLIVEAGRQHYTADQTASMLALVEHESSFDPNAKGAVIPMYRRSKQGKLVRTTHGGDRAKGLFQHMAATAAGQGFNRDDPEQQIRHGVSEYLRLWNEKGGARGATASWISGPGNVTADGRIKKNHHDGNQSTSDYVNDITAGTPGQRQYLAGRNAGALAAGSAKPPKAAATAPHAVQRPVAPAAAPKPRVLRPGEDPRVHARAVRAAARDAKPADPKAPPTTAPKTPKVAPAPEVDAKVALDGPGFGAKLPGGSAAEAARQQVAMHDIRLDNRIMVIDQNGRELGNTVTQTQTRVGAPVPAGTARA
jgi:hypothetical protein